MPPTRINTYQHHPHPHIPNIHPAYHSSTSSSTSFSPAFSSNCNVGRYMSL